MDRRAEHKAVRALRLFDELVGDIVKDAFPAAMPALHAGDAILHGLCPELEDLRLDALFFQCLCDLGKCREGAPRGARTSVDQ